MTDQAGLAMLLRRSSELHQALDAALTGARFVEMPQTPLAIATSKVVLEHGMSICLLVEAGNLASANALLRAQFEALVRGLWDRFAANDDWFAKYWDAARANPTKDPNISWGMDDMLDSIATKAPPQIAPQLVAFKTKAWGPLNSFVHGGVHPIALQVAGPDFDMVAGTVRNSNGLTIMSCAAAATLTGDQRHSHEIALIQRRFLDCGPPTACRARPMARGSGGSVPVIVKSALRPQVQIKGMSWISHSHEFVDIELR